jgi:type IV secretory pathway VirB10-like protein
MADTAPGTAALTDQRVAPRGVLPRGTQTGLMLAVALGILGIIVFTGRPRPAPRAAGSTAPAAPPNPDRLRDYQDRLRVLDERARQQAVTEPRPTTPTRPAYDEPSPAPARAAAPPDPIHADRTRREYDSLFASNVVLSRRPEGQRLTTGAATVEPSGPRTGPHDVLPAPPSLDAVAEAVTRATARYAPPAPTPVAPISATPTSAGTPPATAASRVRPAATGPIGATGPLHRVLEGTVIDTVLTNRLDGGAAAPVNCLVTNAVYSHDGQHVLIPAGTRVLGETKPVQTFGETRLAVAFDRLVLPDGRTYRLDQFMGLNDIGDAGLRDQVNHHYTATFGAAAAVGLITGFAQALGTAGLSRGSGDRPVIIAGGVGETTTQATAQTMNRFTNRLPTVTIREGHRVKVYVTNDVELPAYDAGDLPRGSLLATAGQERP